MRKSIINLTPNQNDRITLTSLIDDNSGQVTQELTFASYSNSASINFGRVVFTPKKLRRIAAELEKFELPTFSTDTDKIFGSMEMKHHCGNCGK